MGNVKFNIEADGAKARSELVKVEKAVQHVTAEFEKQVKVSERAQTALQKEIELRKKETLAKRESVEEGKKLATANAKQANEIDRLNAKVDKQKASQSDMLMTGAKAAAGMAASYLSLSTILGVVTAQQERMKAISEKSLTETERVAKAQSQIVQNMPDASRADVAGVDSRIKAAAARSGASLPAFYESVAATSAATGGDIEAAIRGTEATAPLTNLDPSSMPVIASAAAEVAKATGLGEEAALGLMFQYGGVARQTNTQQIAMALPEALAAGAGTSANRAVGGEWAMERMASLSVETGDREGRRSATAIANLAVKMEKFFEGRPELGVERDPYAREDYLRNNPALAREFMAGLGGEITSYVPIRDLFTPGSPMHRRTMENQALIDGADSQGTYDNMVDAAQYGTPELEMANRGAASKARTDALMLKPGKSTRAQVADEVARALEASGDGSHMSEWGSYIAQTEYGWASAFGDPITAGEGALKGNRTMLNQANRGPRSGAVDEGAIKVLEEIRDQLRDNQRGSSSVVREE